MTGDIVIIEPIHKLKARIIYHHVLELYKPKMVLVIGGISGTAKTECAIMLQRYLWEDCQIRVKVIHLDDYYQTDFQTRDVERKQTGIIGKEEMNWTELNKIVGNYKRGEQYLFLQHIHKYLGAFEYVTSPATHIDLLVMEGLYANYIQNKDFGVYLEGSMAETYEFRKLRGKEDPDDEFRQFVLKKEQACVAASKKYADLVIPFDIKEDMIDEK